MNPVRALQLNLVLYLLALFALARTFVEMRMAMQSRSDFHVIDMKVINC